MAGSGLEFRAIDTFHQKEWFLAVLFFMVAVVGMLYWTLFQDAVPMPRNVAFTGEKEFYEDRDFLCKHLGYVQRLVPEWKFKLIIFHNELSCGNNPAATGNETIYLRRKACDGPAGESGKDATGRYIFLCLQNMDMETLTHEYLHHRRGHVSIPKTSLRYYVSELTVTLEVILRWLIFVVPAVIWALGALLLFWALRKLHRSRLWRGQVPITNP